MKPRKIKLLFLANHLITMLYIAYITGPGRLSDSTGFIPYLISTLILLDISYIITCNLKNNKMLNLFSGLLALNCWYIVFTLDTSRAGTVALSALGPVILCASARFTLVFFFQDTGYQFKRFTGILMVLSCIGSIIGLFISPRVFACMYGIQFLVTVFSFFLILVRHHKRMGFVWKSERKYILTSFFLIFGGFALYCILMSKVPGHLENFGVYLIVLLFFFNIHAISLKKSRSTPLSSVFHKKQAWIMFLFFAVAVVLISYLLKFSFRGYFLIINLFIWLVFLCNIMLEQNFRRQKFSFLLSGSYNKVLEQIRREEQLKADFSNYLHDEILQDVLSLKNLMSKSEDPKVQKLILNTLDDLNGNIRRQMRDYHPVIVKSLTLKENYQNLIEETGRSFPYRTIITTFSCPDDLFLVEPYHLIIYRFIKELTTNVYKHSKGNYMWVTLSQEKGSIQLCVKDNGTSCADTILLSPTSDHKGISSIQEQTLSLSGEMKIQDNTPRGISVQITMPMKGEHSYENFVSR